MYPIFTSRAQGLATFANLSANLVQTEIFWFSFHRCSTHSTLGYSQSATVPLYPRNAQLHWDLVSLEAWPKPWALCHVP